VVAVPTLMIFIGIPLNRQDYHSLDGKVGQLHNGVDAKTGQPHNDMIMVHSILREFEGRLSKFESRP